MSQKLKSLLKLIWWLLVLTFVSLFLHKNLNATLEIVSKLPLMVITIAFLAIVVAKVLLVLVMHLALCRYQIDLGYRRCFTIYNITQLGKYIPGSIWQYVGRITLYKEAQISNAKIRDTLLLETFWVVFSALLIGLCLILLTQHSLIIEIIGQLPGYLTHPLTLGLFAALIIALAVSLRKTLQRYARQFMFSPIAALVVSSLWICLGFSFWITLLPYASQDISFIYIVGLYALSYALGFAVPFAPAGIGVREALLVMGLLPYLDANTAIVLATINRLFYIISEILLVLISNQLTLRETKESLSP
ncbi:MAG: hypothetical protein JAY97_07725 [Candidatus Thiodiazotropha sp. 'RUGA']|nr:hypothetical protein [Candidatus Thiodiazotropha sp. 'RUGA']